MYRITIRFSRRWSVGEMQSEEQGAKREDALLLLDSPKIIRKREKDPVTF